MLHARDLGELFSVTDANSYAHPLRPTHSATQQQPDQSFPHMDTKSVLAPHTALNPTLLRCPMFPTNFRPPTTLELGT